MLEQGVQKVKDAMLLVTTKRNGKSYSFYESMPMFEAEIARETSQRLKVKTEKKLVAGAKARAAKAMK